MTNRDKSLPDAEASLQARCAMGVDRLPSGNYRARIMVGGQTRTATFATEQEAEEWLVVTHGRAIETRAERMLTVEQSAHQ